MMSRPKTAKGMLKQISRFLTPVYKNEGIVSREERVKLWNVLSALRGPDYGDSQKTKAATTAVIRHHALGDSAVEDFALSRSDTLSSVNLRRKMSGLHFTEHAVDAFLALGLNWHELNPDPFEKEE
jgi:hypothetical protein